MRPALTITGVALAAYTVAVVVEYRRWRSM